MFQDILHYKISKIGFDFRIIFKKWARQSSEKDPKIGPFNCVKMQKTQELLGALPLDPIRGP